MPIQKSPTFVQLDGYYMGRLDELVLKVALASSVVQKSSG